MMQSPKLQIALHPSMSVTPEKFAPQSSVTPDLPGKATEPNSDSRLHDSTNKAIITTLESSRAAKDMLLALPEEMDTSSEIEVKVNIKSIKDKGRVERANNTAIFMASGFSHRSALIVEANPYLSKRSSPRQSFG